MSELLDAVRVAISDTSAFCPDCVERIQDTFDLRRVGTKTKREKCEFCGHNLTCGRYIVGGKHKGK